MMMMMQQQHRVVGWRGVKVLVLVKEDYTASSRLYPLDCRTPGKNVFGFPSRLVAHREKKKKKRPNTLTSFVFFEKGRKSSNSCALPRH